MAKNARTKTGGWYYRLELSKKRGLWGFIFLLPWLLGFILFFMTPLVESISYSLNEVSVVPGGVSKSFVGLSNYQYAFTVDPYFNRLILTMVTQAMPTVAIVIVFSLLAAILLNGKFPGRGAARTIFFIPIIMGSRIAASSIIGNDVLSMEMAGNTDSLQLSAEFFLDILYNTGLPAELTIYVTQAVSGIFSILAMSGVPVLIFLAGLQSISPALYEVAKIEGSSAYEAFWKVTLPMVSPMILLCTVYTIIDQFFRHQITVENQVLPIVFLQRMNIIAFDLNNYGLSSAMTTVFMLVTIAVVGLVTLILSRVVFYYD